MTDAPSPQATVLALATRDIVLAIGFGSLSIAIAITIAGYSIATAIKGISP